MDAELQLKRCLLVSALAVLRCPMDPAAKDATLSSAIALLTTNYDDLQGAYPTIGLDPYDRAIANYFNGNSIPVQ
jgi:hypothetical protein